MNKILIHLGATGWLATYSGPHSARIASVMGSATIPTAFTSEAPSAFVVAAIQRLNPGVMVEAR